MEMNVNGASAPSPRRTVPTVPPGVSLAAFEQAMQDDGDEMDFGQVLALYEGTKATVQEGQVVTGTVMELLDNHVVVDVGFKSEGLVPLSEFAGPDGKPTVKVGDRVDVLLERTEDAEGYVVLSKDKAEKIKIWEAVEKAFNDSTPITGRVVERIKGGLAVDIGVRAFLPGSLVDVRPVRDLESLINQDIQARVIKVNRRRGNIVLSRKAVLEEENKKKKTHTLELLQEGAVMIGIVKNITDYGAFIDLGGIDGLLHITDMSWGRVGHPSEMFTIGQEVEVVILKFDPETERVSLGYKQRRADPWEVSAEMYPIGKRVRGRVVSLTDFGAFIEVEEGIDGLVHISDLSWTKRIQHPSEILKKGEEVEAVILNIDPQAQRLSLGIKQLHPDAYQEFFERYHVGDVLLGKVVRMTDFGLFVELKDGVEGLVHVSELADERIDKPSDRFKVADEVMVKIVKLIADEKKIGLSIREAVAEGGRRDMPAGYVSQAAPEGRGGASLGDFMGDFKSRMSRPEGGEEGGETAPEAAPEGDAAAPDAAAPVDETAPSDDDKA
jgi:small subunit ribosomal protein S1